MFQSKKKTDKPRPRLQWIPTRKTTIINLSIKKTITKYIAPFSTKPLMSKRLIWGGSVGFAAGKLLFPADWGSCQASVLAVFFLFRTVCCVVAFGHTRVGCVCSSSKWWEWIMNESQGGGFKALKWNTWWSAFKKGITQGKSFAQQYLPVDC